MGRRKKIGEGNERPSLLKTVGGLVDFLRSYHPPKNCSQSIVADAVKLNEDPALRVWRYVFDAIDDDIKDIKGIIAKSPELQLIVIEFHEKAGYKGQADYLTGISVWQPKKAKLELSKRTDVEYNGINFNLRGEHNDNFGSGEDNNLAEVTRMILDCAEDHKVTRIEPIEIVNGQDRLSIEYGEGAYIKRIIDLYNLAL